MCVNSNDKSGLDYGDISDLKWCNHVSRWYECTNVIFLSEIQAFHESNWFICFKQQYSIQITYSGTFGWETERSIMILKINRNEGISFHKIWCSAFVVVVVVIHCTVHCQAYPTSAIDRNLDICTESWRIWKHNGQPFKKNKYEIRSFQVDFECINRLFVVDVVFVQLTSDVLSNFSIFLPRWNFRSQSLRWEIWSLGWIEFLVRSWLHDSQPYLSNAHINQQFGDSVDIKW